MKEVAQLVGLELNEEFRIKTYHFVYKIAEEGLMYCSDITGKWIRCSGLEELINGKIEIVKLPKQILDKKEKEYLSNVIKPFRDRVFYIRKYYFSSDEFIEICVNYYQGSDDYLSFELPLFKKGTMYTGMQIGKRYTVEELGL